MIPKGVAKEKNQLRSERPAPPQGQILPIFEELMSFLAIGIRQRSNVFLRDIFETRSDTEQMVLEEVDILKS